jgi:hypothetical protein
VDLGLGFVPGNARMGRRQNQLCAALEPDLDGVGSEHACSLPRHERRDGPLSAHRADALAQPVDKGRLFVAPQQLGAEAVDLRLLTGEAFTKRVEIGERVGLGCTSAGSICEMGTHRLHRSNSAPE